MCFLMHGPLVVFNIPLSHHFCSTWQNNLSDLTYKTTLHAHIQCFPSYYKPSHQQQLQFPDMSVRRYPEVWKCHQQTRACLGTQRWIFPCGSCSCSALLQLHFCLCSGQTQKMQKQSRTVRVGPVTPSELCKAIPHHCVLQSREKLKPAGVQSCSVALSPPWTTTFI